MEAHGKIARKVYGSGMSIKRTTTSFTMMVRTIPMEPNLSRKKLIDLIGEGDEIIWLRL